MRRELTNTHSTRFSSLLFLLFFFLLSAFPLFSTPSSVALPLPLPLRRGRILQMFGGWKAKQLIILFCTLIFHPQSILKKQPGTVWGTARVRLFLGNSVRTVWALVRRIATNWASSATPKKQAKDTSGKIGTNELYCPAGAIHEPSVYRLPMSVPEPFVSFQLWKERNVTTALE